MTTEKYFMQVCINLTLNKLWLTVGEPFRQKEFAVRQCITFSNANPQYAFRVLKETITQEVL